MEKGRLEAFSDGVFAIIITIMVLELKAPHETGLAALRPLLPVFLSYALSYVFVGIYWNNHHHTLQAIRKVNGTALWANLHLLFWLSLIPFVTDWVGKNHFLAAPVAAYGFVLLMCAIAYTILVVTLIRYEGPGSQLARAVGQDRKGKISIAIYLFSMAFAFINRAVAVGGFLLVAVLWLIPDRRIEKFIDR